MKPPRHGRGIPLAMIAHMMRQAGLILLAAAAAALITYRWRDGAAPPAPPVGISDETVFSGPKMIDVDTAFQWFEDGSVIFIDTRGKYDFAGAHIPGAIHLDADEAGDWMMEIYQDIPRNAWIIVYADDAGDGQALKLAERLMQIGFDHVYHLATGWQGWLARGLPFNDTTGPGPAYGAFGKTPASP